MKIKLIITIFILLQASTVIAEPEWSSSNIKESDCANAHWKEQGMCYVEYYGQRLNKLEAYLKGEIIRVSGDKQLVKIFEGRESSWYGYAQSYCSLTTYCPDEHAMCGSGYNSSVSFCNSGQRQLRIAYLEEEVRNGIETYYGKTSSATEARILITKRFEISLLATCDFGFFDCDKVIYQGVNKETEAKITLNGKTYNEYNKMYVTDIPKGSTFMNGDTQYSVSNEGVLKVTHKGKVLVSEQGTWKK